MEILFQNSYSRNDDVLKEFYRFSFFRRTWLLFFNVLYSISFLGNILSAIFGATYYLEVLIIAPAFFLLQIILYFRQLNVLQRRSRELHGKDAFCEVIVTNDFVESVMSDRKVRLEYDKFKYVAQTKNLILLISKAKLAVIFRKDSFTKGIQEDFLRFLEQKGLKIR